MMLININRSALIGFFLLLTSISAVAQSVVLVSTPMPEIKKNTLVTSLSPFMMDTQLTSKTEQLLQKIDKDKEKNKETKLTLEDYSFIATIFGCIITGIAAFSAVLQYIRSIEEGRRALAYQNYADYLKFEFDNIRYSNFKIEYLERNNGSGLQYKVFVANMLFAFEQIFPYAVENNKKDWLRTMRKKISRHHVYLRTSESLMGKEVLSNYNCPWLYIDTTNIGDWDNDFSNFIKSSIHNTQWEPKKSEYI